MDRANKRTMRLLDRVVIGLLVLLAMLLAGLQAARAAEVVPSVGLTRATSGDGGVKPFAGLALRGSVLPKRLALALGMGCRLSSPGALAVSFPASRRSGKDSRLAAARKVSGSA